MEKVVRNIQFIGESQHRSEEQRRGIRSLCEICSFVWSRNMGTDGQTGGRFTQL